MLRRSASPLALIAYRCGVAHHERSPVRESSTLTIHRGGWAFCPSVAQDGHRWVATGGITLQKLLVRRPSAAAP